jgi:hypothetical protein
MNHNQLGIELYLFLSVYNLLPPTLSDLANSYHFYSQLYPLTLAILTITLNQ